MPPDPPQVFRTPVRVPYAHVDRMGFVYYANYLVYFEMARSQMLREAGMPYPEMERRGIWLPVLEACCNYRRPAHYDDLIVVHAQCARIEGIRLRIEYEIRLAESGDGDTGHTDEVLVTGYTQHVCMSPAGKVLRLAPELVKLVEGQG